jgi:uncharacterized protein YndB with AHSA1/START domain
VYTRLFSLLASLVGLALLVTVTGFLIPVEHEAAVSARFDAAPNIVFDVIADVERYAAWRSDIERVEMLSPAGNPPRFREHGRQGVITYVVEESVRPSLLRVRIADDSLPFGGTWTYVLQPFDNGTSVTITENGEVYNPLYRLLTATVLSQTATIQRYLIDLAGAEPLRGP